MKKIVLPIDGSARSQRTIAITKQIFHGQDAEITLLMVLPEPRYTDAQAERDRATIQANQELADFARSLPAGRSKPFSCGVTPARRSCSTPETTDTTPWS